MVAVATYDYNGKQYTFYDSSTSHVTPKEVAEVHRRYANDTDSSTDGVAGKEEALKIYGWAKTDWYNKEIRKAHPDRVREGARSDALSQ